MLNSKSVIAALTVILTLSVVCPANAQQPIPDLTGTTWTGKETLPGFDQLTFKFNAKGEALMIDAKDAERGTVRGKWTQQGANVEIEFADCVYRGCIVGQTMSGTAEFFDGNRAKWTWQVKKV